MYKNCIFSAVNGTKGIKKMTLPLLPMEITTITIANISAELKKRGWSLLQLSKESGVPYDTLKKLLTNRIENPHLCNIVKIAYALNIDLNQLVGLTAENNFLKKDHLTHKGRIISYISELEDSLILCRGCCSEDYIPLYTPLGSPATTIHCFDSCCISTLAVDHYRERFGEALSFAIRITTNSYHPVYYDKDILLIGRDRPPLPGETGIFIHDGRIFLRKYQTSPCITLLPVNLIGNSIYLDSFDGWYIFGYVLSVYRG